MAGCVDININITRTRVGNESGTFHYASYKPGERKKQIIHGVDSRVPLSPHLLGL